MRQFNSLYLREIIPTMLFYSLWLYHCQPGGLYGLLRENDILLCHAKGYDAHC